MSDTREPLPPLHLRDHFDPASAADWTAQALEDLYGQAFESRLLWHTDEGLTVKPYFTREDLERLPPAVPPAPEPVAPWRIDDVPSWPPDAIRADLVHDAGGTAVHELAWSIAEAVDRWASADAASAASGAAVVFAIGSTYFVEIAKLRAARRLWTRARGAFDDPAIRRATPCLYARSSRANKSVADPHTNLLRVTTEAMAAVIGGADAVLVEPHGFAPHLAVDVQHLLAEEAHLGATADPAAGSYCIEWLTDALAESAWRTFQAIESAGGYASAIGAGLLAEQLAASREARRRDVATGRRTLVGVNRYPAPDDYVPAAGPFPLDDAPASLTLLRLAAPFERLRARTARHVLATGHVPHVHLVTRGDPAGRTARAAFSRSLFGCAGFTITEGDGLVPGADLIVLCGADTDYAAMLAEVAPGATAPVIVAGRPDLLAGTLAPDLLQGYVHTGIDAVQELTRWQDRVGMAP